MNYKTKSALKFILFSLLISAVMLVFSLISIHIGNICVFNANNEKTIYKMPTVIIDAGHGGEDGGAEANGVTEKHINLNISRKLADYFRFTDIPVVLTRTDDRLLYNVGEENRKKYHDISNRIKFAEKYSDAVFISIHQNKFEISKYNGLQVYYSKNNAAGRRLAELIQRNERDFNNTNNKREIKQADSKIRVLNELEMPAVLVECGFLSNPEEAKMLSGNDYQNKLAFIIFISALQFLDEIGD